MVVRNFAFQGVSGSARAGACRGSSRLHRHNQHRFASSGPLQTQADKFLRGTVAKSSEHDVRGSVPVTDEDASVTANAFTSNGAVVGTIGEGKDATVRFNAHTDFVIVCVVFQNIDDLVVRRVCRVALHSQLQTDSRSLPTDALATHHVQNQRLASK